MTDYHLLIESYRGLVPWAEHVTGKVRGPDRSEWNVEQSWTPGRWKRWSALHYEKRTDSPRQFTDHGELIQVAVQRFLGQLPVQGWEPEPIAGRPADPGPRPGAAGRYRRGHSRTGRHPPVGLRARRGACRGDDP